MGLANKFIIENSWKAPSTIKLSAVVIKNWFLLQFTIPGKYYSTSQPLSFI